MTLASNKLNRRQPESAMFVELIDRIPRDFRRESFIMHVQKEIHFFYTRFEPLFDALYPQINTREIGRVQAVADKTNADRVTIRLPYYQPVGRRCSLV